MGDVVLTLVLKQLGRLPPSVARAPAPILVTIFDEASVLAAIQLATELRQAGVQVACYPRAEKLQKQLKYADRMGAPLVLIAGPDEWARNVVTVKDLPARKQHTVARVNLIPMIQQSLRSQTVKRE